MVLVGTPLGIAIAIAIGFGGARVGRGVMVVHGDDEVRAGGAEPRHAGPRHVRALLHLELHESREAAAAGQERGREAVVGDGAVLDAQFLEGRGAGADPADLGVPDAVRVA